MNARPDSNEPAQARISWADWVTIWQSEWAALAVDREMQEAAQRGIDRWAAAARDNPTGRARPAAPAGPAPALAAPDRPGPGKPEPGPF